MTRTVKYYFILLLFLAASLAGWYFYSRYASGLAGEPLLAMPGSAAVYFKFHIEKNEPLSFSRQPAWNLVSLLMEEDASGRILTLDSLLRSDDDLQSATSDFFVSLHPVAAEKFDFLFLSGTPAWCREEVIIRLLEVWHSASLSVSKRRYESKTIYEVRTPANQSFTFCLSENVVIGSRTPFLVEDAIRQQKAMSGRLHRLSLLTRSFFKQNAAKTASVHINYESAASLIQVFTEKSQGAGFEFLRSLASVSELQFENHPRHLLLTGRTLTEDSLQFAAFIAQLKPVKPRALEMLPASVAFFKWLGMSTPQSYHQYLRSDNAFLHFRSLALKQYDLSPADLLFPFFSGEFISGMLRPSSIRYENQLFSIIRLSDPYAAEKAILKILNATHSGYPSAVRTEHYNRIKIRQLRIDGFQQALAGSLAPYSRQTYFTITGNYLIMAAHPSALRTIADEMQNNQMLIHQKTFTDNLSFLRSHSNYTGYYQIHKSAYHLDAILNDTYRQLIRNNRHEVAKWDAIAFQFTGNAASPETRITLFYSPALDSASLSLTASEKTDTTLSAVISLSDERLQHSILIQDDENQLYKINSSGNILWKTRIAGKIISPVYTTDIYRNGQEQFIFNTENELLVMDTDGDLLLGFPLRLPDRASAPLYPVSFASNTRHAILIPTFNGRVYAYQPSGKVYPYWSYSGSEPVTALCQGSFAGNDFIAMLTESGRFLITNPVGTLLHGSSSVFNVTGYQKLFSDPVSQQFVFCTQNGNVIFTSPDGKSSVLAPINSLITDFSFADYDSDGKADLIFLSGNRLEVFTISGKPVFSYDFKAKQPDRITTVQAVNRTYILAGSQADDLTWVFERQTGAYRSSPVKGGIPGFVSDLNKDGKAILVTASPTGFVYLYAVH